MSFLSINEGKWKRCRVVIIYFKQILKQIRYGLLIGAKKPQASIQI
jgi:hypothetical protein